MYLHLSLLGGWGGGGGGLAGGFSVNANPAQAGWDVAGSISFTGSVSADIFWCIFP